jgi:hypothetical protein
MVILILVSDSPHEQTLSGGVGDGRINEIRSRPAAESSPDY